MKTLLEKLVLHEPVTEDEVNDELYEVCSTVHSSCDSECPVFRLNGNQISNTTENLGGCDCFKNGAAMARFIRAHSK